MICDASGSDHFPASAPAGALLRPVRRLPARRSGTFLNLLRKEARESRAAIVAGLSIYWLMPLFLMLMWLASDTYDRYPVPGFAWFLMMVTGWLYAVIVGAHTMCRDWGRPEEHFLLARPVSPRAVILAKLLVGAAVVLGVMLVGGAWDLLLAVLNPRYSTDLPLRIAACLLGMVLAVGYALAFCVAVLTRQMLTSVLTASLVLLIWAVAPLLSTRIAFLHPQPGYEDPASWGGAPRLLIGPHFFAAVAMVVGACVAIALLACTRERTVRLGHKGLSWMVALVVLALFGAAMSEVGNSLLVVNQIEIREVGPELKAHSSVIEDSEKYIFLSAHSVWRDGSLHTVLALNQLSLREGVIEQANLDAVLPALEPLRGLVGMSFDAEGTLTLTGVSFEHVYRVRLRVRSGSAELLDERRATLPKPAPSEARFAVLSAAATERFVYLVSVARRPSRADEPVYQYGHAALHVIEWPEDAATAAPIRRVELPGSMDVRLQDGHVLLGSQLDTLLAFNADDPGPALEALSGRRLGPGRLGAPWRFMRLSELVRTGGGYDPGGLLGPDGLVYVSDRRGLRVYRQDGWQLKLVGAHDASPLSMVYRNTAGRKMPLLSGSLLVEFTDSGFVTYDVSEPSRPRRTGFFTTRSDDLAPLDEHLLLREGSLLTLIRRPN